MTERRATPINLISDELATALGKIEPGVWGTPCSLLLKTGELVEQAIAIENARYSDAGSWIRPDQVASILECPSRLPRHMALAVHNAGESGMGYHMFTVTQRNGETFTQVASNLTLDFVSLSVPSTTREIAHVTPHRGDRVRFRTCNGIREFNFARAGADYPRSNANRPNA